MPIECAALTLSAGKEMLAENEKLECLAPAIDGSRLIALTIAPERVRQLSKIGRRSPIYELFYNVCGRVPPVNNIGYHEQDQPPFQDGWGGLKHTHAIFRGIRRPMNGDGVDRNVYVFVVSPKYVYRYVPGMVCLAKRYPAPTASVFVAYVVFDDERCEAGKVSNWEWVEADADHPNLPSDFKARYDSQVWANG